MSGSTHTPGPWTVDSGAVYTAWADNQSPPQRRRIAFMDREEPLTRPVERDANALLAAAAPELLEVLEDIVESGLLHDGGGDETGGHMLADARAAIRKARGEGSYV